MLVGGFVGDVAAFLQFLTGSQHSLYAESPYFAQQAGRMHIEHVRFLLVLPHINEVEEQHGGLFREVADLVGLPKVVDEFFCFHNVDYL